MKSETKTFPLRVVLSASTGRLLTKGSEGNNGIGDLYELFNWLCDDNLFTHQLPRAFRECRPYLFRWFPELADIDEIDLGFIEKLMEDLGPEPGIEQWLIDVQRNRGLKDSYDLPRIPVHSYQNPIEELAEMMSRRDAPENQPIE